MVFRSEMLLSTPLRFRGSFPHECPSSECLLFCKDAWSYGFHRIYVNPVVQVAYDLDVYRKAIATPYYKKHQHLLQQQQNLQPQELPPIADVCCRDADETSREPDWGRCRRVPNRAQSVVRIVGSSFDRKSFSNVNYHTYKVLATINNTLPFILSTTDYIDNFMTDSDRSTKAFASTFMSMSPRIRPHISISSSWPPLIPPPVEFATGKRGILFPWEFCSIPKVWVPEFNKYDFVWIPTTWLRRCLELAGVEREKILLLPNSLPEDFFSFFSSGLQISPLSRMYFFRFIFFPPFSMELN